MNFCHCREIMNYRIVTLLLMSMMLFGLHGTVAQAATTTVACSMGGTFTITDNVVTRQLDCTGSATIPAEVTSIGNYAFYTASALTTVTFADGSQLTSIGYAAFGYASKLTAIYIPAGVTSIGNYAFWGASKLATITFATGSQLTSIGESAFRNATALTAMPSPQESPPSGRTRSPMQAYSPLSPSPQESPPSR